MTKRNRRISLAAIPESSAVAHLAAGMVLCAAAFRKQWAAVRYEPFMTAAAIAVLLAMGTYASVCRADTAWWTCSSGGTYNSPANWLGGTVPASSTDVVIAVPSSNNTITFPSSASAHSCSVLAGSVTFNISGTYTLLSANVANQDVFDIGGGATLRLANGSLMSNTLHVGPETGDPDPAGVGTLLVDGPTASVESPLYIGAVPGAKGTMEVLGGGQASAWGTYPNGGYQGDVDIGPLFSGVGAGTLRISGVDSATKTASRVTADSVNVGTDPWGPAVGSGTLQLDSGGVLVTNGLDIGSTNPSVTASVTASGSGTSISTGSIAMTGQTMSVLSGASVFSSGDVTISGGSVISAKVTVSGPGTTWNTQGELYVAQTGSALVRVTNGASLQTAWAWLSTDLASRSGVLVSGTGSHWTNTGDVAMENGEAITVASGGQLTVSGSLGMFDEATIVAIDVGHGSALTAGDIFNNGTIRILAGAGVPTNTTKYSPITAGSWSGFGTFQAIGGKWDATNHQFTVSTVAGGTSGAPVALNLASVQRALISDVGTGKTGWTIGASFPAAADTTDITFTASVMNGASLQTLDSMLAAGSSVLSGWTFATTDYSVSETEPIYLSFKIGANYPSDDLDVWQYNGSGWTEYPATDLTYDGTYASFTATNLGGFAVTVPEPGTFVLLIVAGIGLLALVWRKHHSIAAGLFFSRRYIMLRRVVIGSLLVLVSLGFVAIAQADVFNMGGTRDPVTGTWTGQASLEFVPVGDPGNAADAVVMEDGTTGYGSVGYAYQMGKYDVTVGQYTAFLNAVAKTDTYSLYSSYMATDNPTIGIARSGSSGRYIYSVTGGYGQAANCPVFEVTWGDAARFCNWLQNGQPTSGVENASTTENGAYTLNGATSNSALTAITRNSGATYVIPTESEWYKAAYYDPTLNGGTGGYWPYPTKSNTAPGNTPPAGANYYNGTCTDPTNYLTPVGAFAASPGPYGTYDMGGDVWQWNETATGSSRGFRGGGWLYRSDYLASSYRGYYDPTVGNGDRGFRVASVPEPGTFVLLIAAGIGLLALVWRKHHSIAAGLFFSRRYIMLRRIKLVVLLALAFAGLTVSARADVFLPLDAQINLGGGNAITPDWLSSSGEPLVTFENDGVGFTRMHLLNGNGAGSDYYGPNVDLVLAGVGSLDLSQPGTTIAFAARYYQAPEDYPDGRPWNEHDAPIGIQLNSPTGTRSLLFPYHSQWGDAPYPTWTDVVADVIVPSAKVDIGDAGTFDVHDVTSIMFVGTDWPGQGNDFFDVRALAITTAPEPSTLALLAAGAIGLLAYVWRRRRRNIVLPSLLARLKRRSAMIRSAFACTTVVLFSVFANTAWADNLLVNGDFEMSPILGPGQTSVPHGSNKMIETDLTQPLYPYCISGITGWTYATDGTSSDHGLARVDEDFGLPTDGQSAFINTWNRMMSQTVSPAVRAGDTVHASIDFGTRGDGLDAGRAGVFYLVAGEAASFDLDQFSGRSIILAEVSVANPTWTGFVPDVAVPDRQSISLSLDYTYQSDDPALGLPLTVAFRTVAYSVGPTYWDNASIQVDAVPEPSTLALLAAGAIGLIGYVWRRRQMA